MSRFTKLELINHILSSPEPSFIFPKPSSYTLLLDPFFDDVISPFHDVTTITDLITPSFTTRRLITTSTAHIYLQSLSDRVSALELAFDLEQEKQKKSKAKSKAKALDRKYTWTAEINGGVVDRKYKVTTEIKGGKKESKWTAEIKSKKKNGGGQDVKKYTFTASTGESNEEQEEEEVVKKDVKKKEKPHRIVENENEGVVAEFLSQFFP